VLVRLVQQQQFVRRGSASMGLPGALAIMKVTLSLS
jgi:hypothetical protein